ncbi:GAF domain-containing protein [Ramlibacter rhizophilus]|uniref:GAF domain-containing protein n=1 Tax=Ramlibacter rhizophilus TaxID=1781167 RepID=UPI001432394C|nr:GAF domain-containing protein [Ramlibacter rhizophilus]
MRSEALVEPLGPWVDLLDGLQAQGGLAEHLARIDQARIALLGPGLLTVSVYDAQAATLQRVWTSNAEAYPVGGRKHKPDTPWSRQVLQRCEIHVCEGDAAIRDAFDDHARIASLGLHGAINVPLATAGRCIATFNLLRPQPRWTAPERLVARLLAALAWPAVLRAVEPRVTSSPENQASRG